MTTSTSRLPAFTNEIDLVADAGGSQEDINHLLVFFIPGNPGLVGFYDNLLNHIHDLLLYSPSTEDSRQQGRRKTTFHIHGGSLAGFEIGERLRTFASVTSQRLPISLDEQTADVHARLQAVVIKTASETGIEPGELPVILIGHSIGAYMSLETISQWQRQAANDKTSCNIVAGIGLFPTVFELAHSPMGRKVGPLTRIPYFAFALHCIAKALFFLVPTALVTRIVQFITGMPSAPAHVTAAFLKSKHGVQQALHMAKDELAQLTHDTWSDEFWATTSVPASVFAQLYFYFGEDDHWVAASTRDRLIAARSGTTDIAGHAQRPVMEIDRNGIPHAFCLSEAGNTIVAEKCAAWIRETEQRVFGAGRP